MQPLRSVSTRRAFAAGFVLVAAMALLAVGGDPAYANHQSLVWSDGSSSTTFGPNQQVEISVGGLHIHNDCDEDGIDDHPLGTIVTSDIYVVPAGVGGGGSLSDVSGTPNTAVALGGLLFGETIGFTKPSGAIGPGRYAVVYDECRDGTLDPIDAVFDPAFEVVIPSDVPSIDPLIGAVKSDAATLKREYRVLAAGYIAKEFLDDWRLRFALYRELPGSFTVFKEYMALLGLSGGIVDSSIEVQNLLDLASHYAGIEADPPEPDYQRHTPLTAADPIDNEAAHPVAAAGARVANEAATEAALAEALLESVERYQGADQAGDGPWALGHATAARAHSAALADQLRRTREALASLDDALAADPADVDDIASSLEQIRARVEASGLSEEEQRALAELGLSDARIAELEDDFVASTVAFEEAAFRATLGRLMDAAAAAAASFETLATGLDPIIEQLRDDPASVDGLPVANPGGPYVGRQGTPISFDASGSRPSEGRSIAEYSWDFDLDGSFDDGSGSRAAFTFEQPVQRLVGVRVTDDGGGTAIAYARVVVEDVNRRPAVTALTPRSAVAETEVGETVTFGIESSDPEADSVTTTWRVDGAQVSTGPAFTYATDNEQDIGPHIVEAVLSDRSDGNPFGGSVTVHWVVLVAGADDNPGGNHAPVAVDDADSASGGGSMTIDLLDNDRDPDGDELAARLTTPPDHGEAVLGEDGRATFTPAPGREGVVRFTYAVEDGHGGEDQATVTVLVTAGQVASRTWTNRHDFGQGTAVNVVADVPNRLELDDRAAPFDFIWVAVSSNGTIVKVDTHTGAVLGEYRTAPQGEPTDPSRTTVDLNGNVWTGNRAGSSVIHVGLTENGQCVDRNRNGRIDTSSGLGDVLEWDNVGGADSDGGVSTAADECVLHYTKVRSSGVRHLSVTAANDVWVSGTGGRTFDLVDGETGEVIRSEPSVNHGGYGGLIDDRGVLWSARPLLRWDTAKPLTGPSGGNWTGYGHDSYGLCIDPAGNVWSSSQVGEIYKYTPGGTLLGKFDQGARIAQGCVVDRNGDVWVAHSLLGGRTVGHLRNDGSFVGNVTVGDGPTGVALDGDGKIWVTNYHSRNLSRIDPDAGPIGADGRTRVGEVDLTSGDLGGNLYNYSDMTGSTLTGRPETGTWAAVFDSGRPGTVWGGVDWKGGTAGELDVTIASSEDGQAFGEDRAVGSGATPTVAAGRYLRVTVAFSRSGEGGAPVLDDLTVWSADTKPPVAEDQTVTTPEATPVTVRLRATDPEGGALTYAVVDQPAHGTVSEVTGDEVTYTPEPGFSGTDRFTFRATDPAGSGATATVTVRVIETRPPSDGCTITGTPGDDVLTGTLGDDVICGFGGNDRLDGLAGNDLLLGGAGDDRLEGGFGVDELRGEDGHDELAGDNDNDVLLGGAGEDRLEGSFGTDELDGGDGDDTLLGGRDNDRLRGGAGDDHLEGDFGTDELEGGDGDDHLLGGPDNDQLDGGPAQDHCNGGSHVDAATGCETATEVP